jgi:cytochrome c peroxidase
MRALAIVACAATAGCGGKVGQGGPPLAVVEIIGADPAETSLGKALFFDTRVSSSGTTACATCHQPERGFSDGKRFSQGASGATLPRHTPHLYNLASMDVYFWDGRATSLEEQARLAIENPDEMGGSLEALVSKLSAVPDYERQFQAAFPRDGITTEAIVRAIASFVRSLVSAGSPYDRYLEGEADALTESADRGRGLFFGRANCSACHSGPNLTDGGFHNTGVPGDDRGRAALDRVGEFRVQPYPFFQTNKAFKTPGLRNVALSAPYFHDGSEATLRDVVRFYDRGGKDRASYGLSADIKPLGLTDGEIYDVVAFLESLTSRVDIGPTAPLPVGSDRALTRTIR